MRKNAILLRLSEGVALLVANSKAEQGRWIAALNKVINTALTWKQVTLTIGSPMRIHGRDVCMSCDN